MTEIGEYRMCESRSIPVRLTCMACIRIKLPETSLPDFVLAVPFPAIYELQ